MAEHKVYQSEILRLLEQAGFDPEDVHSLHIEYDNVWAEVFVRDEKGNWFIDHDLDEPATTVVPVKWVGQFHDEEELQ